MRTTVWAIRIGFLSLLIGAGDRVLAQSAPEATAKAGTEEKVRPSEPGALPSSAVSDATPAVTTDTPKTEPKNGWLDGKYMTGDWGGQRTKLSESGVDVKFQLMNQLMQNLHGGLETKHGFDTAGSYELDLKFDFAKLLDWKDASFYVRTKGSWGGDDSDFDREKIGGLFKTNGDGAEEEAVFIDKWWMTQFLFDQKLELRFGRFDPTKDLVDTSKIMGHEDLYFLNSALVRNVTIPAPKGLGLYANWNITKHVYVRGVVLDAQSEDRQTNFNTAFHDEDWFRFYGEFGCKARWPSSKGPLPGNHRVGVWYDPVIKRRNFNTLGGALATRLDTGDWGFYAGFEQMLWKENEQEKDAQGFSVAWRFGWADGEVNRFDLFWSGAVQYEGLLEGRDKDVLGVGFAQAILADEIRRVRARADRETVYELYYSYYVSPFLQISPSFQFVTQAGGDEDDDNATVLGLRIRMLL